MEESHSASWWLNARNRPPNQSPWLQAIISDLDEKIKRIVNLIEDEGDSFTEKAEQFYKRRPELLTILRQLHQSYQNLADSYDNIRLVETARVAKLRSPFSSLRQMSINRVRTEEETRNPDPAPQSSGVKVEEEVETEVTKLMEDNMRQQMELIRRNEEKRETIKELRDEVSRLREENRAMKSLICGYEVEFKRNDSNSFKLKGLNCLGSFHTPN